MYQNVYRPTQARLNRNSANSIRLPVRFIASLQFCSRDAVTRLKAKSFLFFFLGAVARANNEEETEEIK